MKKFGQVIKHGGILIGTYLGLFLILFFSKELAAGIQNGIFLSCSVLLPSMLIFMIFSNLIMATDAAEIASLPFQFLAKRCFKIGKRDNTIVLLSLVGGYPIGAKLVADEVKKGQMSDGQASRMLAYCVNCGPAFLISGVGGTMFGSIRFGLILYLSQVISCLLVGFLSSFALSPSVSLRRVSNIKNNVSKSALLVNAVQNAIRSMAMICGFVMAFSAFLPVISVYLSKFPPLFSVCVRGLLEVTNGCQSLPLLSLKNPMVLAAVFTGFCGICVQVQLFAMLQGTKISMKPFYLWRLPYILLSIASTLLLNRLFPETASAFAINRTVLPKAFSVSPVATAFLILLCIMLLFFNKKSDTLKKTMKKQAKK